MKSVEANWLFDPKKTDGDPENVWKTTLILLKSNLKDRIMNNRLKIRSGLSFSFLVFKYNFFQYLLCLFNSIFYFGKSPDWHWQFLINYLTKFEQKKLPHETGTTNVFEQQHLGSFVRIELVHFGFLIGFGIGFGIGFVIGFLVFKVFSFLNRLLNSKSSGWGKWYFFY